MTSAQTELFEKEKQLAAAKTWRSTLISVRDELQRKLDLLPRFGRTRFDHRDADFLTKALQLVNVGLTSNEGEPFPIMAPLVNRPGLVKTDETITRLEKECASLRDYVKWWPTPDTKNEFKYTGRPGKCTIGGRYLEKGDVVALSETQFEAMHDRFEPI